MDEAFQWLRDNVGPLDARAAADEERVVSGDPTADGEEEGALDRLRLKVRGGRQEPRMNGRGEGIIA